MRRLLALLPLSLVLAATSCSSWTGGGGGPALTPGEALAYLDGRPLVLPETAVTPVTPAVPGTVVVPSTGTGQPIAVDTGTTIMSRANISALSLGPTTHLAANVPFVTPINFIYSAGGARFAVEATLEHNMVGNQRAFFGFHIIRIAKQ